MGANEKRRCWSNAPEAIEAFRAKILVVVLQCVIRQSERGAARRGDVDYLAVKLATSLLEKHHARNRGAKQCAFEASTAAKAEAYVAQYFSRRAGVFERPGASRAQKKQGP